MKPGSSWLLRVVLGCLACPLFPGGLVEPAEAAPPSPGAARSHWAFQPLCVIPPPKVTRAGWARNPLDQFLLAAMETHGLEPAPPATPEQWLRRVTYGLTGLPPTMEEMAAFARGTAGDRCQRFVDHLLSSPHYGERWARHWLDLARYAESDGFEHDAIRPNTWRYRDYVIDSFNQDKPYDLFLLEQVAGDELWPDRPEAVVATGFNLLGPDMVDSADPVQRRLNTMNDMTDTAASVVLGLTLGCARCHDHKFEPFTQRDYFRWQAFFAGADFQREQPVPTAREKAAHDEAQSRYDERTRTQREGLAQLEAPCRKRLFDEKLAVLSEDAQLAHRTPHAQRTREQEGTVQETAGMVAISDAEVEQALTPADRARRKELREELRRVPGPPALPLALALRRSPGECPATFVLARGDYNQPREQVDPGFPEVLQPLAPHPSPSSTAPHPRAELARWLASASNPLTARVMVNRIWQHHFGHGLVGTPSDFGVRGRRPSHPELLDWLADAFIRSGWSVKAMHRLILASTAYQQSSTIDAAAAARDPENRWFARQGRMRLEGEAIRDSLLAVSHRLNPAMGGPSVHPPIPADLARTAKSWTADNDAAAQARRSVYVFARRNLRFPFFEVFDAPDGNLTCPERGRSTTAPQALTLLNSGEVMEAARATARRVQGMSASRSRQIELGHLLVLGREPTKDERALAAEFLRATEQRLAGKPGHAGDSAGSEAALVELFRAWFNLNAFVYAE